jgi:hypothetical protein
MRWAWHKAGKIMQSRPSINKVQSSHRELLRHLHQGSLLLEALPCVQRLLPKQRPATYPKAAAVELQEIDAHIWTPHHTQHMSAAAAAATALVVVTSANGQTQVPLRVCLCAEGGLITLHEQPTSQCKSTAGGTY